MILSKEMILQCEYMSLIKRLIKKDDIVKGN